MRPRKAQLSITFTTDQCCLPAMKGPPQGSGKITLLVCSLPILIWNSERTCDCNSEELHKAKAGCQVKYKCHAKSSFLCFNQFKPVMGKRVPKHARLLGALAAAGATGTAAAAFTWCGFGT